MSNLSIVFGLKPFVSSFKEISSTEYVDGKPKQELKPATIKRKENKANRGCLRKSQQQSKKLRADVIKTLAAGGKYTARTMSEKIGFAQSAVRRHLQTMAACGAIESETIHDPRYDVTWYWISD